MDRSEKTYTWYKDIKWDSQSLVGKDLLGNSGQVQLQLSNGRQVEFTFKRLQTLTELIRQLESSISAPSKSDQSTN